MDLEPGMKWILFAKPIFFWEPETARLLGTRGLGGKIGDYAPPGSSGSAALPAGATGWQTTGSGAVGDRRSVQSVLRGGDAARLLVLSLRKPDMPGVSSSVYGPAQ